MIKFMLLDYVQRGNLLGKRRAATVEGNLGPPAQPLPENFAETISHPNLTLWWSLSILVAVLFMLVVRRQPWIRGMLLMFSAIWFVLISSYVATFVISEHPHDLQFVEDVGWGYFIQLLLIAYLPWTLIRRFGKVKTQPFMPPAPTLADELNVKQG
ncbi:MAG: hypothetical protein ACI8TQ_003421 [Planctomycetota bacterium]|jgi:hypothetical protein